MNSVIVGLPPGSCGDGLVLAKSSGEHPEVWARRVSYLPSQHTYANQKSCATSPWQAGPITPLIRNQRKKDGALAFILVFHGFTIIDVTTNHKKIYNNNSINNNNNNNIEIILNNHKSLVGGSECGGFEQHVVTNYPLYLILRETKWMLCIWSQCENTNIPLLPHSMCFFLFWKVTGRSKCLM